MTEDKLAHFKKMLLDEKTKLAAEREQYASVDRADSEEEATGALADYDPNDPGDEASNLYDRERDMAAIENMDRLLAKVDRALAKIDDGTYGLSDIDGSPIPEARLEALPYAVTTVAQEEDLI